MLPVPIELLESEELPAHVPAMDPGVIPDGPVAELLPQAAVNAANATAANTFFILPPPSLETRRATSVNLCRRPQGFMPPIAVFF